MILNGFLTEKYSVWEGFSILVLSDPTVHQTSELFSLFVFWTNLLFDLLNSLELFSLFEAALQ